MISVTSSSECAGDGVGGGGYQRTSGMLRAMQFVMDKDEKLSDFVA